MKKEPEILEEKTYCDYKCRYIKFEKNQPLCHTFDLIYCKKYKIELNKGSLCLDYNKKFQEAYKEYKRKK